MALLTIEQARAQCRVIGTDDDAELMDFAASAEDAAMTYLNRAVFAGQPALDTALDAAPGVMAAARATYDAAVIAADALADEYERAAALTVATAKLSAATVQFTRTVDGIIASPSILAAIRLTLGHLYENREDVVVGTSAVELPNGAASLLRPRRKVMMP